MRLADELLLLSYNDEGSAQISSPNLDLGLAGAVLLDLAMSERLDVRDGKLVITDATPTGDPVLDDALARIATDKKARKPQAWVEKLSKDLRERLLGDLVEAGVLRREADRVWGIFPRTRFPSAYGVEPTQEADARQRLSAALDAPDPVEPRTAALAALVAATDLVGKVYPDRRGRDTKKRIKAMTEASLADDRWAADGIRKAIEAVEMAVIGAVVAATTATTAAGGGS